MNNIKRSSLSFDPKSIANPQNPYSQGFSDTIIDKHALIFKVSLLFLILAVLTITGCTIYQKPVSGPSPMVRVLLYSGNSIVIRPAGSYIMSFNSRKEPGSGPVTVEYDNGNLSINGIPAETSSVDIYPGGSFSFGDKKYTGSAAIIESNKNLLLINTVDMESYLRGVLPGEVSPDWDAEALKAQAVVSRTFALYELVSSRKAGRIFDLYGDSRSQSYGGLDSETKTTSTAVDVTLGEVLRYEGKIIEAFFHSASGGMTESSSEVFGNYKPYLTPVQSPYSSAYKDDKWQTSIPLDRVSALLRITNRIASVAVTSRTESKRIKTVEFRDVAGNKTTFQGRELRELFGDGIMKSTRANIRIKDENLVISGAGYGHGVGMGQWDALGMARKGYSYRYILTYFYKGTAIDRIW